MLQTVQYCKGYLHIKVWGFSTERFMNLCSNHNILLWNIKNHGEYYTMCISLKGFYELKTITRKTGTKVAITKRCGLPFFSKRMLKRKIFIAGLLGSFIFLQWIGNYILTIEINGNYFVTEDVFVDFLNEYGIDEGIKKKDVDIARLEKAIRNEYEIITWTSVQMNGNKLIIHIKENDLIQNKNIEKETKNETEGYHLVADKDGVIVDMVTRNGVPKVKIGDEVKAGDILVEGCIPIYQEDTTVKRYEYCKADADVQIKSTLSVSETLKETYEQKIYTGKKKERGYLIINNKQIMIPILGNQYEQYDVLEEIEQLELLDGYEIPIFYGKKCIREYMLQKKIFTKEEVKEIFEKKVQKFIQTLDEKGVQIIEKNVTINKNKGIWNLKVDFVVTQKAETMQKVMAIENNEEEQSKIASEQGE